MDEYDSSLGLLVIMRHDEMDLVPIVRGRRTTSTLPKMLCRNIRPVSRYFLSDCISRRGMDAPAFPIYSLLSAIRDVCEYTKSAIR